MKLLKTLEMAAMVEDSEGNCELSTSVKEAHFFDIYLRIDEDETFDAVDIHENITSHHLAEKLFDEYLEKHPNVERGELHTTF